MNNVTGLANRFNKSGTKSCKRWGFNRAYAVRLEQNNGRVMWSVGLILFGITLTAGVGHG